MVAKPLFFLFLTPFVLIPNLTYGKRFLPSAPKGNTSMWFRVVEDDTINEKILNLYEYLRTLELKDEIPVYLKNETLRDFESFSQFFEEGRGENLQIAFTCAACYSFVGIVALQARQLNVTEKVVMDRVKLICPLFQVYTTTEVCTGVIDRQIPTMYYVLKNRPELSVISFCGFVFQQLGCYTDDPYFEWNVDVAETPKRVTTRPEPEAVPDSLLSRGRNPKPQITRQREEPSPKPNLVKIVQLADIHIDPLYVPGTPAECKNNVMCCRKNSEPKPLIGASKAGQFGDTHKCDPPLSMLELTLKHLATEHKDIELFYMSGDIVPHTVWSSSIPENTEVIESCSELIYKYFPNTKVLILTGNHEAHPVNMFSPPEAPEAINTRWIYNVTYDAWKTSIPADQTDNYFQEGFYSVEISRKLKVVVLNTNICYGFNMWGMYEVKDQGGLLNWLIQELDKSESQGQNVHILGHVPPGHPDCAHVWSRNFYNIISRYRKTVKGQFYGHTHYDEFKLYYSPTELGVPINAVWISPSLTPYEINNPSYKLFYADGGNGDDSTWDILDYETWIFNLEEANKKPEEEPKWYPLYRATTAYNIPDTSFENLGVFVNNMATNKTLFDSFYQHFYKATPAQRKESSVYRQKQILCGIVRPWVREEKECERVQSAVDGKVDQIPLYSNYYMVD